MHISYHGTADSQCRLLIKINAPCICPVVGIMLHKLKLGIFLVDLALSGRSKLLNKAKEWNTGFVARSGANSWFLLSHITWSRQMIDPSPRAFSKVVKREFLFLLFAWMLLGSGQADYPSVTKNVVFPNPRTLRSLWWWITASCRTTAYHAWELQ